MSDPVIRVRDLEKRYRVWSHAPPTNLKERLQLAGAAFRARTRLGERQSFRHDVWALRGVSFEVRRGEVLGVIGHNGAGKSTLLSILARITEPTGGYAEIRGRVSSLLEVGTGFHPELTGRDNVFLNGAILGMSRGEITRKFDEIVEFSGVRDFIDIPVKRYSSGMQVRLAFAVGAHLDPEILLLDEVLAVGDAGFQARCHARVEELTQQGRTVVFVSHDVHSVTRLCERAIVLQDGLVAFSGPSDEAVEYYLDQSGGAEERPRSGDVRVRQVRVDHLGERLQRGVPFDLHVDLDAARPTPLERLTLTLAIEQPGVGQLVVLSTAAASTELDGVTVAGSVTLTCTVPDGLPLRPGTYLVTAAVHEGEALLDRLTPAAEIVLCDDPHDALRAAAPHPAPVVVSQQWRAEPGAQDGRSVPVDGVWSEVRR